VSKHNIASFRVLQKCGIVFSGEDKFSQENGEEIEEIILKLE
jgi:RimJ/RimL family protein N-acetyltransferase